ncbi:methionine ABC transporter substrate-binding protein [Corynebacterium sp. zg254]|uniref:Methionine ABC transporter substrate-binding protein n=1 Tax=Corynebacterium zhongnanshanii TaxID=2768834 RepID=A0ABQ6VEQ5_9CORY|nr:MULTISPECIES: MetQ/NlpA family ABC transporter substrate-binding protein [Corynebacterium]KAB3522917.1 methionine ABC transporter substrate-binding protein [Corynebacterium zhongnanshanii]MCR5914007.1 methionine ABC transporter substrate-binding protein [Corynebacterium sp. zg254]
MSLRRKVSAAAVAVATAFALTACGGSDDTLKIGSTDIQQEHWKVFEQELEKAGIKAQLVPFSDYNIPNQALVDGEIDVNNFQHMMFLGTYNNKNNQDLKPVGATEIIPLGLYYKDGKSLDDVAKAGKVVIPNDPSNQGRAINLLAANKLVTLKKEGLLTPTPADVDDSKSKVKLVPVDAAQTATSYHDGTPAVVNNSFLEAGNIDPTNAIVKDDPKDPSAQPYINGFVTTKEHQNDEELKKLVEIWHSKPVQDALERSSKGTSVEVKMDGEELNKVLEDTQAKLKDQG